MAKRATIPAESIARRLAVELIKGKDANGFGATVILGAGASISSGIPAWPALAEKICKDCAIPVHAGKCEDAVIRHFRRADVPYAQRHSLFREYLQGKRPSIGYAHLGQLLKDGLISSVLTTNWDPLAETAIMRFVPLDGLKVLIRGELPDTIIAEILDWRKDHPTIVKLHGDAQSRKFMLGAEETRNFEAPLAARLVQIVSRCTFIVGQSAQDVDVLSLLLAPSRRDGTLFHVRHKETPSEVDKIVERAGAQVITGQQPSILADGNRVNIGDFDAFFTQLNLAVQRELVEKRRSQLRKAEESILDKEKTGVGYINYTRITTLVEHFALKVKEARPDLILFIDDPSAPGGMELRRRMLPMLEKMGVKPANGTIVVKGAGGSRAHKRSVASDLRKLPMQGVQKVLIIDAITFSGNTLTLARDKVRKVFPNVLVQLGVLVISQQLQERAGLKDEYLHQQVTDRHEIFFPWGVTQTTSTFDRKFAGGMDSDGRRVAIAKRPWGTIEVLADEELTSVRLLTIEAGCRLSFQRHLCRDELFVALDDNIGLDICAEELPRDANRYDEHVKSLILEKSDYVLIPRGVWHRTKASMDRVRLLEVAFGLYDQGSDIERRWDDFDREHRDGRV